MSPDVHEEMTAAAIARLAGVGRAAVSNWRRRYPEFPQPVGGTPSSPTFARVAVEHWLKETGKADQLATAGSTDTGTQLIADRADEHSTRESAVTDLTPGQLLARVMVSLLPRSIAAGASGATEGPVVLDPACAQGTLLMAVADRFADRVRLAGQEIDEPAAALAALNLRAHPHRVHYEIHAGDSLRNDRLAEYLGAAAAAVCEPPFDQPKWPSAELATDPRWEFGTPAPRDSELAWVEHCYAHLRPRGVAVVAVTSRTCVQSSGQSIRAALVRTGVLREVIGLPKGIGSLPEADMCLWVLQRPYGAPDHAPVRMVDLSGLEDPAEVPDESAGWQRLYDDADPALCAEVSRLDLLDGDTSLLPSRWVTRAEASAADLVRVTDRLRALYTQIGRGLPRFAAPTSASPHTWVSVGELERTGALTVRTRETTPRAGDLLLRTMGRPPSVATGTAADDSGVAQVVEIDPDRLDAHFVATFLRVDAQALPVANTLGALSRDDLRRCRVPRLPLAEQRRYGDAFRHLNSLQAALAGLAAVSANVIDQTIHGLTAGAVTPDFVPSPCAIEGETL